jgi:poly-gamma-glutamate capsule biosynthesis protein CapA/YwtB (metallophosphatase superfamily)
VSGRRRALLALALCACGQGVGEKTHSLAFGGDLFLGRRNNQALWEEPGDLLDGLAPVLQEADLAVVNAEGVIAAGGAFADKGEPRPYTFRAIPAAVDALAGAGVDVLLLGNNHSGDYGPQALLEMRDRVLLAGMDVAGGGRDAAEARTPAYRRLGDVVVAVVGVDLTGTLPYRARVDRPGTLCFRVDQPEGRAKALRSLGRIATEARKHAHVVLLAPHWGPAFIEAPDPSVRELARELIDAGYDGILGHGSHRIQGAELIDGRPVLYDAGNLVTDYPGQGAGHHALLYVLELDRRGVHGVKVHPVHSAGAGTRLAEAPEAEHILTAWAERSRALGSTVVGDDSQGWMDCEPGGRRGPWGTPEPPVRSVPEAPRLAPTHRLPEVLPASARPVAVRFSNGVELVGHELLMDRLRRPKAGQVITLYLRSEQPVPGDPLVRLEARRGGERRAERHQPGDWQLPTSRWEAGALVRDQVLMRLDWEPEGTVQFWAGLEDAEVVDSDLVVDGDMVLLGEAPYEDEAPRIFDLYRPPDP